MQSSLLRRLNYDVLVHVFELLRLDGNLRALSMTCRDIRQACKPCLFRCTSISAHRVVLLPPPPSDIWDYIRRLTVIGTWQDVCDSHCDEQLPQQFQRLLVQLLFRMPALETVVIVACYFNGSLWDGIQTVLSCPQVRHLVLQVSPDRAVPIPPDFGSPRCTLASLTLPLEEYRCHPRNAIGEVALADSLVSNLAHSLEHLTMLLDVAPLARMASLRLPRLRELHLKGDYPTAATDVSVPLLAVLSGMPNLRSLTLLRAVSGHKHREAYWRVEELDRFPCEHLEHLSIAYPEPTDELYSHLPTTLRSLTLRCYPRHYMHQHRHDRRTVEDELRWTSPILKASEMHTLLRRCQSRSLEELEIEYEEDAFDATLLRSIASHFPNLRTLTIFRYRSRDNDDVPVANVARALSSLAHLRVLRIHLDFQGTPHPLVCFMPRPNRKAVDGFEAHRKLLQSVANTFAAEAPPSLAYVCHLLRDYWANAWLPYRVERTDTGRATARLESDLLAVGRVRMEDDPGPATQYQRPIPDEFDDFEF
ncbi:hypothetical protein BV20DRAFT_964818 [Pilatotrama ljubarskyi]|nr:hypothetical protein BV20DRAFT_964818 [Pilatotrama ljubarskyi]